MARDSDGFCRWDAAQQLGVLALQDMMASWQRGDDMLLDTRLIDAYRDLLLDDSLDKAMVALMLSLPSEAYLAEIADVADVHAIYAARTVARLQIAQALKTELVSTYHALVTDQEYQPDAEQIARRSLKNVALAYLMLLETDDLRDICVKQFTTASNMTDVMAAFVCLVNSSFGIEKAAALKSFYDKWHAEALVLNQWLVVQATCAVPGTLDHVKSLLQHPAFDIKNPNKVRALIGAFCAQNPVNFHQRDGAGYRFLADQVIILDKLNPQIASRLLNPLSKWHKYPQASQAMMKAELERIMSVADLSKDVYEVVSKSLAQ
jgi:aminopeptidase N